MPIFYRKISTADTCHRGLSLVGFYIFVFRAVLGAGFAVLLMRFFYPKASFAAVMALAVLLVGMAYVMENFRRRKRGPQGRADP
jgi:hypothetical protein